MNMHIMRDYERFKVGDSVTVRVHDWFEKDTQCLPGKIAAITDEDLYQVDIRVGIERHAVLAKKCDLFLRDMAKNGGAQ